MLDGYVVDTIAEPRVSSEPDAFMASVHTVAGGDAWAVAEGVLKQLRDGQWTVRATPRPDEEMRTAIPTRPDRVVVLFASRIAAFDPVRSTWTTLIDAEASGLGALRTMTRGFSGELWIAGARGLGRLDGPVSQSWTAHQADGLADFDFPLPGEDGEVFAAAIDARTRHKVAVRFAGGRYQRVFDSTKALRAWRGPHGSVWVLEGTRTWRLSGGQQEAVARHGPLSGIVYDVVTEPRGVFCTRRHLGGLLAGLPGAGALRRRLLLCPSLEGCLAILAEAEAELAALLEEHDMARARQAAA